MTILIPEVGLAHEGSLRYALGFVQDLADIYDRVGVPAEARVIKFQAHDWLAEDWQRWRPGPRPPGYEYLSRQDYLARTGFVREWWQQISETAHRRQLRFWCSVFVPEAMRRLAGLVDAWKVPHTRSPNTALAAALAAEPEPKIVSVAPGDVARVRELYPDAQLLWCWPTNPTPRAEVQHQLRGAGAFPASVGLSLHMEPREFVGMLPEIVSAGVPLVEVHVCYSRHITLPDTPWSLELAECEQAVQLCREGACAVSAG